MKPSFAAAPKNLLTRLSGLVLLTLVIVHAHASEPPSRPLEPGADTQATLTTGDPRNFNNGSHYHLYRVALEKGQIARFEAIGELNSYLSLIAPNGKLLAYEQNEKRSTALHSYHSKLSHRVTESGPYILAVGGNSSRSTGRYRLALKTLELKDISPLVPGAAVEGWLQGFKATHTLHVDTIGEYRVRFGSDDFSAYLLVDHGSHYESIDSGEQPGEHLDVFFRAAGDYQIIIRPSDQSWQNGLYTLEVEALSCCQGKAP